MVLWPGRGPLSMQPLLRHRHKSNAHFRVIRIIPCPLSATNSHAGRTHFPSCTRTHPLHGTTPPTTVKAHLHHNNSCHSEIHGKTTSGHRPCSTTMAPHKGCHHHSPAVISKSNGTRHCTYSTMHPSTTHAPQHTTH